MIGGQRRRAGVEPAVAVEPEPVPDHGRHAAAPERTERPDERDDVVRAATEDGSEQGRDAAESVSDERPAARHAVPSMPRHARAADGNDIGERPASQHPAPYVPRHGRAADGDDIGERARRGAQEGKALLRDLEEIRAAVRDLRDVEADRAAEADVREAEESLVHDVDVPPQRRSR